jgi:hypothetical protein
VLLCLQGPTLVKEGKQKLTMSGPATASPGNALRYSVPFATSVPSSGNAHVGENALRKDLRSVVMNKVAFEMCKHFNQKKPIPVEQGLSAMCDEVFKQVVTPEGKSAKKAAAEQYFSEPPSLPSPPQPLEQPQPLMKEDQITKALAKSMNEFITSLDVRDQRTLSEPVHGKERPVGGTGTDITFVENLDPQQQMNQQRERPLVALLEVGIETTEDLDDFSRWMSKLGQGVAYLKKIAKDTVTGPVSTENVFGDLKLSKPALLAIVTFDKHQTRMNLGVFCCERREQGSIRMALMYRQQAKGEGEMTQAFGKIIKGIIALGSTRDSLLEHDDFVYLGPNCTLLEGRVSFDGRGCALVQRIRLSFFDMQVLRAYDNRARRTPRSPRVYLEQHISDCDILLDFKDKDEKEVIKFGTDPGAEKIEEESEDWSAWSFSFKGQLMVISVPYKAGSHIPETIRHLQLISEDVRKLHALKLKHGDLRLWNMVFDDNKAALIDFDFSGEKVYYPKGYETKLDDAPGRPGQAFEEITEYHDVQALLNIQMMFVPEARRYRNVFNDIVDTAQELLEGQQDKDDGEGNDKDSEATDEANARSALNYLITQLQDNPDLPADQTIKILNTYLRKKLDHYSKEAQAVTRKQLKHTSSADAISPDRN